MKATKLDGTPTGISSKQLSEGVAGLLIDHVRIAFRQDESNLQFISQKSNQVREGFLAAESSLKQSAMIRLERLQACRARVLTDCEKATAQIGKLEDDRIRLQSLTERGRSNLWSELEIAAAKSIVETGLSDAAQEIAKREQQIKTLMDRADKLFQEGQICAALKDGSGEIVSLLTSGREPQPYQDALSIGKNSLTAAFQRSSEVMVQAITDRRNESSSAEAELLKLRRELNETSQSRVAVGRSSTF